MSRVGKNPVAIPQGVEANLSGRDLTVKGTKGTMQFTVPTEVSAKIGEDGIVFTPENTSKRARAMWGMCRAHTNNMVTGVSEGFERKLLIQGVGYRAGMQGAKLNLQVGLSHQVNMDVPEGLTVQVNDNTEVVITGYDRQKVGQFAANVRAVRPPEPYKGKGIRYADEYVRSKEGKKK